MKVWITLLRREWWEHKAGFCWTPISIAGVIGLLAFYGLALAGNQNVAFSYSQQTQSGTDSVQRTIEWNDSVLRLLDFAAWSGPELANYLGRLLQTLAQPFFYAHFLVALFVLLGSLHDDRRDRSVLFWKSMPVSDLQTVGSKLLLVVGLAPLVSIAAILATQILVLALVSSFAAWQGVAGVSRLWSPTMLGTGALELLIGYAIQGLWSLPIYGWLLLVSATVTRMPFVWAVLAPLAATMLEGLFLRSDHLSSWISSHLQFAALPRAPALASTAAPTGIGLQEQLALLATPDLWFGVAIAAVLLAGAWHFRRRNNDL